MHCLRAVFFFVILVYCGLPVQYPGNVNKKYSTLGYDKSRESVREAEEPDDFYDDGWRKLFQYDQMLQRRKAV